MPKSAALSRLCGSGTPAAAAVSTARAPFNSPVLEYLERNDEPAFERATSFAGARDGFVFKLGSRGLGYYRDVGLASTLDTFQASLKFAGARPGFVFKMGVEGVGYYRDTPGGVRKVAEGAVGSRAAIAGGRVGGVAALSKPKAASSTTAKPATRGFRFGDDNRERTFRAYCETAVAEGMLTAREVEAMYAELETLADGVREYRMLELVEIGMRGREVRRTSARSISKLVLDQCEARPSAGA
jgi:hypothetical protein